MKNKKVFSDAMRRSFRFSRSISPNMVRFDIFKNIWFALGVIINPGLTSLGILMISKISKGENMIPWGAYFIIALILVFIIDRAITEFTQYLNTLKSEKNFQEQKLFIQQRIDTLDPAQLFNNDFAKAKSKFIEKGWGSMTDLYDHVFLMAQGIISLALSITIVFILSPWVIVLALVPGMVSIWVYVRAHKRVLALWDSGRITRLEFNEYNDLISNNRSTLQTIFHGTRDYFRSRFLAKRDEINQDRLTINKIMRNNRITVGIIDLVCTIGAVGLICYSAYHGHVTIVAWPLIYGSLNSIKRSIGSFGFTLSTFLNSMKEYEKYFVPFAELKPMYQEGSEEAMTLLPITADMVTFLYPNGHRPAVDQLSLTIEKGEIIGLVGNNGSGKTTLINLISAVYFPATGSFKLGDKQTWQLKRESVLKHMLVELVFNGLPDTSIREIVGATLSTDHDEEIWESLRVVGLADFVRDLPLKLDTYIGEQWDGGIHLSTGQSKRLSLASLYFKSRNPDIEIIIMDEPMGNIDPETRADLYRKITMGTLFPGKTVIIALHDSHFEHLFKRIITMSQGSIIPNRDFYEEEPLSLISSGGEEFFERRN